MTHLRKSIIAILSLVYCMAAQANPISNDELFNVALLGLDMRNAEASHTAQKYEAAVSCFSGLAGMYINSTKKLMYIGYSFDSVSATFTPMGNVIDSSGDAYDPVSYTFDSIVNSDEVGELKVLSISSIERKGDAILIVANSVEDGTFLFSFSKTSENILTLTLVSAPPSPMGYGDWGLGDAYTNAQYQSEYDADNCEGFEG